MEKLALGLLRKFRRDKNISADVAGAVVNRDRNFIWRIENAVTDIKVGTLMKLLNAYGASVVDVFVKIPERQVNELVHV